MGPELRCAELFIDIAGKSGGDCTQSRYFLYLGSAARDGRARVSLTEAPTRMGHSQSAGGTNGGSSSVR